MPTPIFAFSLITQPSPMTTGATALLILQCGCRTELLPMVMGEVPVSCTCWAMRTLPSMIIEVGLGRMEVRLGTVEERRSRAGRAGVCCVDIFLIIESRRRFGSWSHFVWCEVRGRVGQLRVVEFSAFA